MLGAIGMLLWSIFSGLSASNTTKPGDTAKYSQSQPANPPEDHPSQTPGEGLGGASAALTAIGFVIRGAIGASILIALVLWLFPKTIFAIGEGRERYEWLVRWRLVFFSGIVLPLFLSLIRALML
jgi:hypothetical protein